jgi:hypothetical protein
MCPPLILTLKLDASAFGVLDELRRQHFPPEKIFFPPTLRSFTNSPANMSKLSGTLFNRFA